jgi:hypothetical protein
MSFICIPSSPGVFEFFIFDMISSISLLVGGGSNGQLSISVISEVEDPVRSFRTVLKLCMNTDGLVDYVVLFLYLRICL